MCGTEYQGLHLGQVKVDQALFAISSPIKHVPSVLGQNVWHPLRVRYALNAIVV
jgi:hypothetical protein